MGPRGEAARRYRTAHCHTYGTALGGGEPPHGILAVRCVVCALLYIDSVSESQQPHVRVRARTAAAVSVPSACAFPFVLVAGSLMY